MYWYYAPRTTEELEKLISRLDLGHGDHPEKVDGEKVTPYIMLSWDLGHEVWLPEQLTLKQDLLALVEKGKAWYGVLNESWPYKLLDTQYWNSAGVAVAVVAVLGGGWDWGAYIGGTTQTEDEFDAYRHVMRHGIKLPIHFAKAIFPHIANPYRP